MELYIAIKKAFDSFGKEILQSDKQLMNILSDFHAYDIKATKMVLRVLMQSGYGTKLFDQISSEPHGRILLCKSICQDLINNQGFQVANVNYVVDSLAFALGWHDIAPEYAGKNDDDEQVSRRTFTINGVTFSLLFVEGGTFTIGATPEQGMFSAFDEKPALEIKLRDYYIGETPVTQELWEAVMGSNPSHFIDAKRPVERVSWDDCKEFISKLSELLNIAFRLPTEAEWEYAAKGGNKSEHTQCAGSDLKNLKETAWFKDNSENQTHEVALLKPNELGLYDMSGNVGEWCSDWYSASYANSGQRENPTGPSSGMNRVHRGGCWNDKPANCRVSKRNNLNPSYTNKLVGLRLAATKC